MRCYIIDSVIGKFVPEKDTRVLPVIIQIGEDTYVDDENFDEQVIADALTDKKRITTSQPNLGTTLELYEKLKDEYDEFVLIHTGSKISGTFGTSVSAAKQTGLNFIAIDSKGAGPNIQFILEEAKRNEKMPLEELKQHLDEKAAPAGGIIVPGSLERLRLSGRVSTIQAMMGDFLKITPVFLLEDGELKPFKKERTQKKAVKTMLEYVTNLNPEGKITLLEYEFDRVDDFLETLGEVEVKSLHTALLVHLGRGSVGIMWN